VLCALNQVPLNLSIKNIMEVSELINSYHAGRRNFVGINLSKTDMNGIDLSEANLSGANLSQSSFYGANLSRDC
jgi:uncharacterized protein YjbI with pentapeptide repeats